MRDGIFTKDDVIHTYTRAEALEDGVLVDVTDTSKELFKYPVAFTKALSNEADTEGKRWDVLWMAYLNIRRSPDSTDSLLFSVILNGRKQDLLLVVGPGDHWEPVVTIGFPTDF